MLITKILEISWIKSIFFSNLLIFSLFGEHILFKFLKNNSNYNKSSSLQLILRAISNKEKDETDRSVILDVIYFFIDSILFFLIGLSGLLAGFSITGILSKLVLMVSTISIFPILDLNQFPINPYFAYIIWLVSEDFINYLGHVITHKNPLLWNYHKFHHSPKEFCVLTARRLALGDTFFTQICVGISFQIFLGRPDYQTIYFILLTKIFISQIAHSNLPWDFGIIGKIFVSPRFHKFHHSSVVEHHDSNYGVIFTFWDTIFKTSPKFYTEDPSISDNITLGVHGEEKLNTFRGFALGAFPEIKFLINFFKKNIYSHT